MDETGASGGLFLFPAAPRPEGRVVVWDTETSGFSPKYGARVIEIAAMSLEDGAPAECFHTLISSTTVVPEKITALNGLTAQSLLGQPGPGEVFPAFMQFVGNSPLIAHNGAFDRRFLDYELGLLGYYIRNEAHCTKELARKKLPGLENHKLETVYRHFYGERTQDHRALNDVIMTAAIWLALNK